jgi:Zn-dependent alcohol dehydrogenase
MKIRAAVVKKTGQPFEIETLDLAPPREKEVLVRIRAAGICHSDWNIRTGETEHPLPAAAGHEGAGIVESIGEGVTSLRAGDHVALSWAPGCGSCFYCSSRRPALCETWKEALWAGTLLDGTTRLSLNGKAVYHYCALACFAEYAVVPEVCCVPVDKKVPLEVAALIGCAVTTGLGASMNTVQVEEGAAVVIYGMGGVGLSILAGAQLAGADPLICVDLWEEKLELARSLGATAAFKADAGVQENILAATAQRGADYVFEATGSTEVQESAFDAVRPGGKLILVGLSATGTKTNFPGSAITRQEKTILGSYYGSCDPHRDFPLYSTMYLRGELDLDRLVSKIYRLEEINTAYSDMLEGKTARGIIAF